MAVKNVALRYKTARSRVDHAKTGIGKWNWSNFQGRLFRKERFRVSLIVGNGGGERI
jgi:hypothetical protein